MQVISFHILILATIQSLANRPTAANFHEPEEEPLLHSWVRPYAPRKSRCYVVRSDLMSPRKSRCYIVRSDLMSQRKSRCYIVGSGLMSPRKSRCYIVGSGLMSPRKSRCYIVGSDLENPLISVNIPTETFLRSSTY